MNSIIDNPALAEAGRERQAWFVSQMPFIQRIHADFEKSQPFKGMNLAACMHVEPKTGAWIEALKAGGAESVTLIGCLGTTRPDTAAYLASLPGITVLAKENDTLEDHKAYAEMAMEKKPEILLDNGATLILTYMAKERDWTPLGANEETRTGRLLLDDSGLTFPFPILVIDDSPLKKLLENAIGVGQSVVDGFMRSTSLLIGGRKVLVIGYGAVGSGIAQKFHSLGAHTYVYDTDPVLLLKAKVDGHHVGPTLESLLPDAEVVVTATGRFHVIKKEHIPYFRNDSILCNAGHFGFEIDVNDIMEEAVSTMDMGKNRTALTFSTEGCNADNCSGNNDYNAATKTVYLLENATPLNLSAGDGNPISIMDLGLGLQALCAEELAVSPENLTKEVQPVPVAINNRVSRAFLGFE